MVDMKKGMLALVTCFLTVCRYDLFELESGSKLLILVHLDFL